MNKPYQTDLPIGEILGIINRQVAHNRSFLIGIDGGAGSGKTTFTHWLAKHIRNLKTEVNIIHTDNFFRPSSERLDQSLLAAVPDIDWERLHDQVILPLKSGKMAHFQLYDWPEDCLKDWMTINPGGVTIIDGITALR